MQDAGDRGPQGRAKGGMAGLRRRLAALLTFSRYTLLRFNADGCFAASGALFSASRAASNASTLTPLLTVVSAIVRSLRAGIRPAPSESIYKKQGVENPSFLLDRNRRPKCDTAALGIIHRPNCVQLP